MTDIGLLRARFTDACERYQCVAAKLAKLADRGECPTQRLLDDEKHALYNLAVVRRDLLDALAGTSRLDILPVREVLVARKRSH